MKRIVCLLICVCSYFQLFSQGVDFKQITLKEAWSKQKLKERWCLWIVTRRGAALVK